MATPFSLFKHPLANSALMALGAVSIIFNYVLFIPVLLEEIGLMRQLSALMSSITQPNVGYEALLRNTQTTVMFQLMLAFIGLWLFPYFLKEAYQCFKFWRKTRHGT